MATKPVARAAVERARMAGRVGGDQEVMRRLG